MYINESVEAGMLSNLMEDMKIDLPDYGNVSTGDLERACYQFDATQLEDILKKNIGAEDMFTQQYLYGKNENIKLLVDIGKSMESPEAASELIETMKQNEPLFVRCLVAVFQAWHYKTTHAQTLATLAAVEDVLITDLKEQLNLP
jgi:hypothetical protein